MAELTQGLSSARLPELAFSAHGVKVGRLPGEEYPRVTLAADLDVAHFSRRFERAAPPPGP